MEPAIRVFFVAHHHTVADAVLERDLVEQRHTENRHRIEPAPCLRGIFHNKIRREVGWREPSSNLLPQGGGYSSSPLPEGGVGGGFPAKRVTLRRERHRAGLEPAIKDILNARIFLAINGKFHLVDIRPVQISNFLPRKLLQLRDRTNTFQLAARRTPDRNRRAPEAVARNRPVTRAFEPFAEQPITHMFRHPVDGFIKLHHPVFKFRHLHIPARQRLIDQRLVSAPAMRVVVDILLGFHPRPDGFKVLNYIVIGFKHVAAFEG